MKINVNTFKTTPKNMDFKLSFYGNGTEEIVNWLEYHKLNTESINNFNNIDLSSVQDLSILFKDPKQYKYVDGFSPNLNKKLHIGHISNLVTASALQNMGIGENFISIMGDTLDGNVDQLETYKEYEDFCTKFNYKLGEIFYASKMSYSGTMEKGEGEYEGTMVFDIEGQKIVGIKGDGSTSYFYQDVALASTLNGSTLYLTGFEQEGHFNTLNKLFTSNKHLPLGLVMLNGKKMSSSEGNVIFANELLEFFIKEFDSEEVAVNVLIGLFLKSKSSSIKNVNMKDINNPKNSPGLYLSYTLAHIKSAGMTNNNIELFDSKKLQYLFIKAKETLNPSILLEGLIEKCKEINNHYMNLKIKDDLENQKIYQPLFDDLAYGMKLLGMNLVNKV